MNAFRSSRRAFTLLEIVIVIAMIALASGIAISNMGELVPALEKISPEKSVERACSLAVHSAWTRKKKFFVRLVPEEKKIFVEDVSGNVIEEFSLSQTRERERTVKFFADYRDGTRIFSPSQLEEIFRLEFNPAGCATPALVAIEKDGRAEKIFQLDPFSGGLEERRLL